MSICAFITTGIISNTKKSTDGKRLIPQLIPIRRGLGTIPGACTSCSFSGTSFPAPAFSAQCSNKSCGVEPGNKAIGLINLHLLSGRGQSAKATLPGSPVLTMWYYW